MKEIAASNAPTINNEKEIDRYCEQLKEKLLDATVRAETLKKACNLFVGAQTEWISEKGASYKYGMKDSTEFFTHLKEYVRTHQELDVVDEKPLQYRGTVIKTRFDRNGEYYGFISRSPDNIFFHERDNPSLSFSTLYAHEVLYSIKKDKNGNEKAIEVALI